MKIYLLITVYLIPSYPRKVTYQATITIIYKPLKKTTEGPHNTFPAAMAFSLRQPTIKFLNIFSAAKDAASAAPSDATPQTSVSEPPKIPKPPKAPKSKSFLHKQHTWSPDISRDEEWARLKRNHHRLLRRSKSISDVDLKKQINAKKITDDDLKELKACVELGFGFGATPNLDPKLASAFPALEFYHAVKSLSRSSSASVSSDDSSESTTSHTNLFDPNEGQEMMKARLKQWAKVVACSVREASPTKLVV